MVTSRNRGNPVLGNQHTTFEDAQGHQFLWKTGSYIEAQEGDKVTLKGTIKAHSEYKGIKQTELTRCKVS